MKNMVRCAIDGVVRTQEVLSTYGVFEHPIIEDMGYRNPNLAHGEIILSKYFVEEDGSLQTMVHHCEDNLGHAATIWANGPCGPIRNETMVESIVRLGNEYSESIDEFECSSREEYLGKHNRMRLMLATQLESMELSNYVEMTQFGELHLELKSTGKALTERHCPTIENVVLAKRRLNDVMANYSQAVVRAACKEEGFVGEIFMRIVGNENSPYQIPDAKGFWRIMNRQCLQRVGKTYEQIVG